MFKRYFFVATTVLLAIVSAVAIYVASVSTVENLVYLPSYTYSDLKDYGYDYITVSGTMVSTAADGVANPMNTNEFSCDRLTGQCNLVQAELSSGGFLSTYTESFPIESWDDNFVVFKTSPENIHCVTWTYRIDRVKRELIGVREAAASYDSDLCMGIGLSDFSVEIVDGLDALERIRNNVE
jgi:hypothetical protein